MAIPRFRKEGNISGDGQAVNAGSIPTAIARNKLDFDVQLGNLIGIYFFRVSGSLWLNPEIPGTRKLNGISPVSGARIYDNG